MDMHEIIKANLDLLDMGMDSSPARVAFWLDEINYILDRPVKPDILANAWRRVRADIDSARREGRFVTKPLPETVAEAYFACAPPPDLSGCAKCDKGLIYKQDERGYDVTLTCPDCASGVFRRWQATRQPRR